MSSAVLHAVLAHGAAGLLMWRVLPPGLLLRVLLFWSSCSIILFVVVEPTYVLLAAFLLAVGLSPKASIEKVGFYVLAMPALPPYLIHIMSAPGINYLLSINYYAALSLAVLVPTLLASAPLRPISLVSPVRIGLMLGYLLHVAVLSSMHFGVVAGPRMLVELLIVLFIPLLAITRAVVRPEDIDLFVRSLLGASLTLGALALVIALRQWDFYKLNAPPINMFADFRSGFLRVEATANTHSLGFHLAFGILLLEYLKVRGFGTSSVPLGWTQLMLLRVILFVGLLTTDSRGALASLLVGYGIYWIFLVENTFVRVAFISIGIIGAIGAMVWMITGDFTYLGNLDSFSYRQELIRTAVNFILANPVFGNVIFLQTGLFDHLMQGQGIIDITNLYLLVGVQYGVTGMVLFFGALATPHLMLLARRPRTDRLSQSDFVAFRRLRAMVLGSGAGWFFLVATTSDVALTTHLGLMTSVLARASATGIAIAEKRGAPSSAATSKPRMV